MTATLSQYKFLNNVNNKSRLIRLLTEKLESFSIAVKHAKDDADDLIVETALITSQTNTDSTVIVGDDFDLLVIMTARSPSNSEIFFLKPGKGKVEQKTCSTRSLEGICKKYILFLHAFSGCDGTSAMFQKGKTAAKKLLQKSPYLQDAKEIFLLKQCFS